MFILLKKIYVTLILLFFLILLSSTNVFATDYNVTGIEEIAAGYDYCIVEMSDGNIYLLVPSDTRYPYIGYFEDSYNTIFACTSSYSNMNLGTLHRYKLENGSFVSYDMYNFKSTILGINEVKFSTCDIRYINHSNDFFFTER